MQLSYVLKAQQLLCLLLDIVLQEHYVFCWQLWRLASRSPRAAIPECNSNQGVKREEKSGEGLEADVSPVALFQVVLEAAGEKVGPDEVSSIDDQQPENIEAGHENGWNDDPWLPGVFQRLKVNHASGAVHLERLDRVEVPPGLVETVRGHFCFWRILDVECVHRIRGVSD